MKYFIEDTTLTNIADAVREKEESTRPIPVVELADRIRDIQSGAQLAVTLNEDGTQNLSILDDGKVFDLPALTDDADATPEDVAEGKVFYAKGYRRVGEFVPETPVPVLLWTNENRSSNGGFAAQTVTVAGDEYDAYLIQLTAWTGSADGDHSWGETVVSKNNVIHTLSCTGRYTYGIAFRTATANGNSIAFGEGFTCAVSAGAGVAKNSSSAIPTRIWGVKFTL